MQNSKLIKLLSALNSDEFKRFRAFLRSDFFNTDQNLSRLYDALRRYAPTFSSPRLSKELLFEKLFADMEWDDAKWRNLVSKMIKVLEKYLAILEMEGWEESRLLANAYGRRNLYTMFEKKHKELIEELENKSNKNAEIFAHLHLLNANYYFHSDTKKAGSSIENLLKADEYLKLFNHISNLKLSRELNTRQGIITDEQAKNQFAKNIGDPLFEIYSSIYRLQKKPSFENYQVAKENFTGHSSSIDKIDQRESFQLLLNYAIGQHNIGVEEYAEEVFSLYKYGIENKTLIEGEVISDATYLGIITQGSRLKKFEWIKMFIENYKTFLKPDKAEETIYLGWGYWYFFQSDHAAVIDLLQKIPFANLEYKFHSKWLLIRSYYELFSKDDSYFQLTQSYTLAFEKFLKRNKKFPPKRREILLNFTTEIRKLTRLKYRNKLNKELRKKWLNELDKRKNIAAKPWLMEKINEV